MIGQGRLEEDPGSFHFNDLSYQMFFPVSNLLQRVTPIAFHPWIQTYSHIR